MNNYLFEIGLEEMPAHVILPSVQQLESLVNKTCDSYKLKIQRGNIR